MLGLTVAKVILTISWEESRLHCWSMTHGAEETALLFQDLQVTLDVFLLDSLRIQDKWRHRGATSAAGQGQPSGFHFNHFIPASAKYFQAPGNTCQTEQEE